MLIASRTKPIIKTTWPSFSIKSLNFVLTLIEPLASAYIRLNPMKMAIMPIPERTINISFFFLILFKEKVDTNKGLFPTHYYYQFSSLLVKKEENLRIYSQFFMISDDASTTKAMHAHTKKLMEKGFRYEVGECDDGGKLF
jgi:hypothetical protein